MATNTNAFSACKVITNDDSGYVFNDKAELDMLAENSLVAIDGGSYQGVWFVTKVNAKSLALCGAVDVHNNTHTHTIEQGAHERQAARARREACHDRVRAKPR